MSNITSTGYDVEKIVTVYEAKVAAGLYDTIRPLHLQVFHDENGEAAVFADLMIGGPCTRLIGTEAGGTVVSWYGREAAVRALTGEGWEGLLAYWGVVA